MFYPDEVVEEVCTRNDIVNVVGTYVHLKKKGSSYFGLCPFHNEKSPSFSVSGQKQMYYCFGCGAGGNVITFMMEYENMSFQEALQALAERAGIALPQRDYTEEEKKSMDLKRVLLDMHKEAALYYYRVLYSPYGQKGLQYLMGRGLTEETIKGFGLGFAPSGSGNLYQHLRKKGYTDAQIKESGLARFNERGVLDNFWNRVMFPIMDVNNRVIAFGGRVMGDGEPKYLNSQETRIFDKSRNLYGLHTAKKSRREYFLICEGYMDVISLHQAGFTNAVAALGTAFTPNHAALIKRYVSQVVLTFDSDGAGVKAALRAIPILKDAGIGIKVLTMKPYKDPDEFIKNLGSEKYQERIEQAQNAFLFEIGCMKNEYDLSNPEQKTAFYMQIARRLLSFTVELERTNYMEAVCREHRIDFGEMKKLVNSLGARLAPAQSAYEPPKSTSKKPDKEEGIQKAERLLLTWITEEPSVYEKIADIITAEDFSKPLYKKAAALIIEQAKAGSVNPGQILNGFINDEEEYKEAAALFQMKLPVEPSGQERSRAFTEAVVRVKRNSLEQASRSADITRLQEIVKALNALQKVQITLD